MSKGIEYKPPTKYPKSVFLAGSIEMGAAEDWQQIATGLLAKDFTILNPRRDDWDSSWEQKMENKQFFEQVSWELEGLERADFVLLYFAPETKSPISLLELGLFHKHSGLIVICPEGFWRKGNVDVVCKRYRIKMAKDFISASAIIRSMS